MEKALSGKDVLYEMATKTIRLFELCSRAQKKKVIPRKDYNEIKGLVQELQTLAGSLP